MSGLSNRQRAASARSITVAGAGVQEFQNAFVSKAVLRSLWAHDYDTFRDSPDEATLLQRLIRWANRGAQNERAAQAALIEEFFRAT